MATVDRVLPWRRHAPIPADEIAPVVDAFRHRHPKAPIATIVRAYEVAAEAHEHQYRKSGEKYINHPISVAKVVADIGLDDTTVAAALLHDAVEDTEITIAEIEERFGSEVAQIVDGVTKLERIRFDSREEQQAATMRKMLVAMAKDLRVLIIKLADRLHNLRTIAAMSTEKQVRQAQETLDIYAPLAHRLGMQEIKQQLEDLSFAALHPKRYAEIDSLVALRTPEQDHYVAEVVAEVQGRLAELKIDADVTGRGKHLWSIYEKMVLRGKEFDDIFDLVGIRVIVDSVKDCYAALGCIHGAWKPVVGPVQGLHRHAQVQPVPVAAHDGDRSGGQAARGADPHPGDAPPGRDGAWRRTGPTRRARPRTTWPGSTASWTGRPTPTTPTSSWRT